MSVPYNVRKRINPQKPEEAPLYYPASIYFGEVNMDKIATDIAERSSLTKGDVASVMESFLIDIPKYLLLGYKVRLEGLGIFKLSISGNGKPTEEEVTVQDITSCKILFTPDVKIKTKLEKPEYSKMHNK